MNRILSTAGTEFRIALRNRWVAIALVLMAVFRWSCRWPGLPRPEALASTGCPSLSPRSPRCRST